MRKWMFLLGAIALEVAAAVSLSAALSHPGWFVLVAIGYVGAFWLFSLVLREGLPLGVAYGLWGAAGVAFTAGLGSILLGQELSAISTLGVALIIIGVLVVELGSRPRVTRSRGLG